MELSPTMIDKQVPNDPKVPNELSQADGMRQTMQGRVGEEHIHKQKGLYVCHWQGENLYNVRIFQFVKRMPLHAKRNCFRVQMAEEYYLNR